MGIRIIIMLSIVLMFTSCGDNAAQLEAEQKARMAEEKARMAQYNAMRAKAETEAERLARIEAEKKLQLQNDIYKSQQGTIERYYQVTQKALEKLDGKVSKPIIDELARIEHPKDGQGIDQPILEEEFLDKVREILATQMQSTKVNEKNLYEIKIACRYARPYFTGILVRMGDVSPKEKREKINELVKKIIQNGEIVPYSQSNIQLTPTRNFAKDENEMWKSVYLTKVDSYQDALQSFYIKKDKLAEKEAGLEQAYAELRSYAQKIEAEEKKKAKIQANAEKRIKEIKKRINATEFDVIIYVEGKYENHVTKEEAFKILEYEAQKKAIDYINGVYVESLTTIIKDKDQKTELRDYVKNSLYGEVKKVGKSNTYDNYDFDAKKQAAYGVYHFSVSKKERKNGEKGDNVVEVPTNRDVEVVATMVVDDRNIDSFVFPATFEDDVSSSISSVEKNNRKAHHTVENLKREQQKNLMDLAREIKQIDNTMTSLKNQKHLYETEFLSKKIAFVTNTCNDMVFSQNGVERSFGEISHYGKDDNSGKLHYVFFGEREIRDDESADLVAKKLTEELIEKMDDYLKNKKILSETEILNNEFVGESENLTQNQNGTIKEIRVILRSQRQNNLKNLFGLGLWFVVEGAIDVQHNVSYEYNSGQICFDDQNRTAYQKAFGGLNDTPKTVANTKKPVQKTLENSKAEPQKTANSDQKNFKYELDNQGIDLFTSDAIKNYFYIKKAKRLVIDFDKKQDFEAMSQNLGQGEIEKIQLRNYSNKYRVIVDFSRSVKYKIYRKGSGWRISISS